MVTSHTHTHTHTDADSGKRAAVICPSLKYANEMSRAIKGIKVHQRSSLPHYTRSLGSALERLLR